MATYKFITSFYPKHLSPKVKILTGQRFNRLLVIGFAGIKNQAATWHCLCDCGNGITATVSNLRRKNTQSCGCLRIENGTLKATHGASRRGNIAVEYAAYIAAQKRCNNPQSQNYPDYGERGIEFRFNSFEEFLAEVGKRPSLAHSLDRKNNDGHYEIGNVRWATKLEQNQNTRKVRNITAFGKTQCLNEWAREYHHRAASLFIRLKCGWCVECALVIPKKQGVCPHKHNVLTN